MLEGSASGVRAGVETRSGTEDEVARLICEREPIHIPGSIQPHGALLAFSEQTGIITHASANLHAFLGVSAVAALGQEIADVLGGSVHRDHLYEDVQQTIGIHHSFLRERTGNLPIRLRAHRSGERIFVDMEPVIGDGSTRSPILIAQAILETFKSARSSTELCDLAISGLKRMTGYDRVMAYQFGEGGHGEVIAERCESEMVPYLGLRYPANDIPAQARRQYLAQRVGSIVDSSYEPVTLLASGEAFEQGPLDLTHSALRSVSPVHREYMRNMQTAASMTVGLARDGELWGMLVCHHRSPRMPGHEMRAAAGMVGEVVSMLLASFAESAVRVERSERSEQLRSVVSSLATPTPLMDALILAKESLLGLVGAGGALLNIEGKRVLIGLCPPARSAEHAFHLIDTTDDIVAIDDLVVRYPELHDCTASGSGALLINLDRVTGDAIVFFRPEIASKVTWGGDPSKSPKEADGRVWPRKSFAAWQQTVRGRSQAWSEASRLLAGELRNFFQAEVAQRTRSALRDTEARFRLLAEHSGVVVTLSDLAGIWRYVSPAVERVLGWRPDELRGRHNADLVHPNDLEDFLRDRVALLQGTSERSGCFRMRRSDGEWLWVEGHGRLRSQTGDSLPTDYVVVLRDATERKAAEDKLTELLGRMERMATIDGLTGLSNRRHFDETASGEWRRCEREGLPFSLLLLDADRFKLYNDAYGHMAGDDCLRVIGAEIGALVHRSGDLAARYGGEEFVLLLSNTSPDGALQIAERARDAVRLRSMPHDFNLPAGVATVSVGVATAWPGAAGSEFGGVEALLAAADRALYRAKAQGRNRVEVAGDLSVQPLPRLARVMASVRGPLGPPESRYTDSSFGVDYKSSHEVLMQFLYRAPIGLVQISPDGVIEMINPMSANLLMPLSPDGNLDNLFTVLERVAPQFRQMSVSFDSASGSICEAEKVLLPTRVGATGGAQVLSVSLLKLDDSRLMAMLSDVTAETQREQSGLASKLDAAARTDALTKMPNRTALRELISRAIERRKGDSEYEFAVLFMNCDRFKQINDSLGHSAGNEVLALMADRMRSTLRQRNRGSRTLGNEPMAGRLGGDEFVVILDDLRSGSEVFTVASRLLDVLSQPYSVRAKQLHFSISMGIVVPEGADLDADMVLRDSSIAMVEAKRGGGSRYVRFEKSMHERASKRGDLENDLRQALTAGQLFVVYPPVVTLQPTQGSSLSPMHAAGVEALVRWRHPVRGVVPPIEFISVAEDCGLISALGEFVLSTACRQFVQWQSQLGRLAPRLLAVNLSRAQLGEPDFVQSVLRLLHESGMKPTQLQLEVTESLAAQDETIQQRLHELRALGLTLALDDFGTGYSSLASLHQLPVNTVKIDRSFVSEAVTSAHHRVLIEATIRVSGSLNMGTVAEGIETEAQASLLRELGCEKGQGYFYSKPLLPEDLPSWLRANDR